MDNTIREKEFTVLEKEDLFIEMVRYAASFQSIHDVYNRWIKRYDLEINGREEDFLRFYKEKYPALYPSIVKFALNSDGKTWHYMGSTGNNFFDLYCKIKNMSTYECAKEYAKLYNLECNKLIGIISSTDIEYNCIRYSDNTPDKISLQNKTYVKTMKENIYIIVTTQL